MIDQLNTYFLLIMKIFFFLGAILYLIFSIIVHKQTTTMTKNIYDKFNSIIIVFSYTHLIFSVLLVILTLTL